MSQSLRSLGIPRIFLSVFLLLSVSTSHGLADPYDHPPRLQDLTPSQRELMDRVMQLARPAPEELVMYHYGKAEPCQRLIESGTYKGAVFEKYSRLRERSGTLASHGI
jgi:hypothetical protein